ncbi:wnt inhibitory factor 1-like [Drosophila innubila]|uniref:wnt inhibitory factor 1-like n=1 Tax=Drosophila innubila TaxID=198719 RepID=UPI00148DFCA0|nr:wnt inhibitory factor 1-like [Drosophila innubila]
MIGREKRLPVGCAAMAIDQNGKCVTRNTCSCNEGYDNIQHNPAYSCVPVCKGECKNGDCTVPPFCNCYPGYEWNKSTGDCDPVCSNDCPNGRCESPGNCICNQGYSKNETQMDLGCQPVCEVECDDNRVCVAPNKCDWPFSKQEVSKVGEIIFLRRWMIEFAVGLVFLIILIISVWILISRHNKRVNAVARTEKDYSLYVMDNKIDVQEI